MTRSWADKNMGEVLAQSTQVTISHITTPTYPLWAKYFPNRKRSAKPRAHIVCNQKEVRTPHKHDFCQDLDGQITCTICGAMDNEKELA